MNRHSKLLDTPEDEDEALQRSLEKQRRLLQQKKDKVEEVVT